MSDWAKHYYAVVDSMDVEKFAPLHTEDVSLRFGNAAHYGIAANDCLGIAETKTHILCVERPELLHIHGIDHCIVAFYPVRHRILLLWYDSTRYRYIT